MTRPALPKSLAHSAPHGALCRADLLRLLVERDRAGRREDPSWIALDESETTVGYRREDETPAHAATLTLELPTAPSVETPAPPPSGRRLPRKVPFLFAVTERRAREFDTADATRVDLAKAAPLRDEQIRPKSDKRLIGFDELVPRSRLVPGLRRFLSATRQGPLDTARLANHLAARKPLRRVPRATTTRWNPEIVVLLDGSPRLRPYRHDMQELARMLLGQCGRGGLSLRMVYGDPHGPWTDLLDHWSMSPDPPRERPWSPPSPGARIVLVTDLGLLRGVDSDECRMWADFAHALAKSRHRPVALVPLGAEQVDTRLFPGTTILRWSPDARLRPERSHGAAVVGNDLPGLADLVAMVAMMSRVDPPLLRALRRLNPQSPHNAGLEGALWEHPDIEVGSSAIVKEEAGEAHRARFKGIAATLRDAADQQRREHHAHLPIELVHFDTWRRQSLTGEPIDEDVQAFFRDLAATLTVEGAESTDPAWWRFAEEVVEHADDTMRQRQPGLFYPLLNKVRERAAQSGRSLNVTGTIDPAAVAHAGGRGERHLMRLVHDLRSRQLLLVPGPPGPGRIALSEPMAVDGGGVWVRVGGRGRGKGAWLAMSSAMSSTRSSARSSAMSSDGHAIAPLDDTTTSIEIETATEFVRVEAVARPRGAQRWGLEVGAGDRTSAGAEPRRSHGTIFVETPSLMGGTCRWSGDQLRFVHDTRGASAGRVLVEAPLNRAQRSSTRAAATFGIDAPFGLYADLTVTAQYGTATQRFRWIEPGEFWMGSPETEAERFADEGPRHRVTLTRGFWLADTACTQAMWSAVTGKNPSQFKGDDRPVENVSWRDVRAFLARLSALLPECETDLPTEAEWEYACRAGTETPFSFGETITPEQVNHDGNVPYAGGAKGLYRRETVPVKSLPANPWGLYEMHGNVWEWCADGMRAYSTEPVEDPRGPEGGDKDVSRVVRGGSWISYARRARSAGRYAGVPGGAYGSLGFRFCLRSVEPKPSRAEPARPPGGRPSPKPGGRGDQPAVPTESAQPKGFAERLREKLGVPKKPIWRTDPRK